jgi:hypothetical protein
MLGAVAQAAKDAETASKGAKEELSRPLKIYRDTLFSGATDQTRSDAATELLMNGDDNGRDIVLTALKQDDNPAARMAVYKVLIDSRRWSAPLKGTEVFIEPLMAGLKAREGAEAQQIAEATMIFDYKQIAGQLKAILDERSAGVKPRLNAVYAFRIRPEGEAISELIKLLDDSDDAVAAAASEALQEWIPLGSDKQVWRGILEDLKKKSRADIVKERLKVLELQKRDLSTKLDTWQKLYLGSLKRIYDGMPDAASRQAFLSEQLQSEHSLVKLWGLERVREISLSEPQLPVDIASKAVSLVNDPDPAVRLATAKLLALKSNVDSATNLLSQLKVETDESVKPELLSALGVACYYALLPGSQITLPDNVRNETLDIASQYLLDKDAKKAGKGADTMGKLLEQNGLKAEMSGKYLEMLQQRYVAATSENKESPLRVDLLKSMSRLCGNGVHKVEAARLFGALFSDSVKDSQAAVRGAAIAGLIAIDNTSALVVVRQSGLANDASPEVRGQVAKLAESVGDATDLQWLSSKLGVADESDAAWQAMKRIFERSDVKVAIEWVHKCEETGLVDKIGVTEWPLFLKLIEQKAGNTESGSLAVAMRQKLAAFYKTKNDFDNAALYYRQLMEAESGKDGDNLAASYVEMCLKSGSTDSLKAVKAITAKRVDSKKFRSDDVVVAKIDEYLAGNSESEKVNTLISSLGDINGNSDWQSIYGKWQKEYIQNKQIKAEESPQKK